MVVGKHDRWRLMLTASAVILSASGAAEAQQAAPPAQAPAPAPVPVATEDEEIVVIAAPSDQVTRIDRRVYTLGNDAVSQSSQMLDVLARVPSVTVDPEGRVRLLGAGATIQVDGQAIPGQTLDAVLRSLSGSDIERIEVVTNPSAQFSAQTEGGVINIITRQRFRLGLTGVVQGAADSTGNYDFNISPTWSRGALTYGFRLGLRENTWEGDATREREDLNTGDITYDEGAWDGGGGGYYAAALLGYRPNDRRRMNVRLDGFGWDNDTTSTLASTLNGAPQHDQSTLSSGSGNNTRLYLDFQQNGDRPGEVLKWNAQISAMDVEQGSDYTQTPADGSPTLRYFAPSTNSQRNGNTKLDWERPIGENNLLSMGFAFDFSDQEFYNAFETLTGPPAAPDYESTLTGTQATTAAYGMYQFKMGRWTFMPAVRVEQYRRELNSGGVDDSDTNVDAFPSVHLRRELAEDLDFDLSYSRRITRPQLDRLNPAIRYWEATRASTGNPDLQPMMTDAFEANVVYQTRERTYSVTLFDRITDDIFTNFTELTPDGVLLSYPVNGGESEQRGAQVIFRAPLGGGWRYSINGNVLQREFDALQGGALVRRSELEYGGGAQLEYRDRVQSDVGADHLQFDVQFTGPQYELQSEQEAFASANFTWRRRLTPKIFGIFSINDIFDSRPDNSEIRTADFIERSEEHGVGTRFRFALTYQFGSLQAEGPPPDGGGGGPPEGMGGPGP